MNPSSLLMNFFVQLLRSLSLSNMDDNSSVLEVAWKKTFWHSLFFKLKVSILSFFLSLLQPSFSFEIIAL